MPRNCIEEPDLALRILKWILELTKAKIMELIDNFKWLVTAVFQAQHPGEFSNPNAMVEEKIASSVLLCIINLLIIVLARAQMFGS